MNDKLREFISEYSGIRLEKIISEARIQSDLRITGDDSEELIIAYGKTFNVDVSQFMEDITSMQRVLIV